MDKLLTRILLIRYYYYLHFTQEEQAFEGCQRSHGQQATELGFKFKWANYRVWPLKSSPQHSWTPKARVAMPRVLVLVYAQYSHCSMHFYLLWRSRAWDRSLRRCRLNHRHLFASPGVPGKQKLLNAYLLKMSQTKSKLRKLQYAKDKINL